MISGSTRRLAITKFDQKSEKKWFFLRLGVEKMKKMKKSGFFDRFEVF